MEIVSGFVREQQRYSRDQLRDRFEFDEAGIERFIKNLKSYGILKAVANSARQRELTDLADEDLRVVDEAAGNEDCLYVFPYVGVVTMGNRVIKSRPKYMVSEGEPLAQMRQVMKVLERYSRSEEQVINLFNGDGDKRSFNLLAVILYLLHDYFEHGIYSKTEEILEVNGEGDIAWGRTIDDGFAILEEGRPYYAELITRRAVEDEGDFFRRLHECILTDCSAQLRGAGLEDLFEMETVTLSQAALEEFGDREYVLDRIRKELDTQYHTRIQMLWKTIYIYVSQNKRMLEGEQGLCLFGTTAFHAVWERACAEVFGNMLHMSIGAIPMNAGLAAGYEGSCRLIDLIKKPKWCGADVVLEAGETLIPDIVSISRQGGQDWFMIFDAKYYLLQLEKGCELRGNPGIGDVAKQYLYQLAYRQFIADHGMAVVKNCFLMPTEGREVVEKGVARLEILSALGLEDIQIRQIPAEMLFGHYLSRRRIDVRLLRL